MPIHSKKVIISIFLGSVLVLLIGGAVYFYLDKGFGLVQKPLDKQPKELTHNPCLSDNEIINYEIIKEEDGSKSVVISIYENNKDTKKFNFYIKNIYDHGPTKRLRFKCNIYIVREFNFDYKRGIPLEDYEAELWSYHYNGTGKFLMTLFKKEEAPNNFSSLFSIDPFEKYIVLERSYLGNPNYALVVKDLETKKDVFVLPLSEITNKYPHFFGSFSILHISSLNEWTKNGRYFWGNIFDGANVLAFFRIEKDTWKYEIFQAPEGTMGGDDLNPELGYVTFDDGPPWTGDLDFAKMYQEEWEKKGKFVSFYLYNLFTKEKTLLATTTDTMWYFKPKWISENELEYELPTGEKKIYKINEK